MGLYIPDLRLPADGDFELWIAVRKDGSFTYNVRGGWQDGKQKAVPVQSHGRLINADAMITSVKRQTDFLKNMGGDLATVAEILEKGILQEIENAPTVIPASEEE